MGFDVDFEGTGKQDFKRFFLEPDSYEAEIISVSDVFESYNPFNGKNESKFSLTFSIKKGDEEMLFPYFLRTKIVHSAKKKGYSDSKLYTLLNRAGVLEKVKEHWDNIKDKDPETRDKELLEYIRSLLLGRRCKVVLRTINPEEGEKYIVVSEIIRFLDVVEEEGVDDGEKQATIPSA